MQPSSKLNSDYLRNHSKAPWAAITAFESIDSTSRWLKTQTQAPAVCLAEAQTQGRGRNGNHWRSPNAENIYLSFSWLFHALPKHLPLLSLWVGIAVAEVIETLGVKDHGIKWPNDLYWQHKKMGGILIETSSASSEIIVGIGINANASLIDGIDQPWTSLSEVLGQNINRNTFLVRLLDALYVAMDNFGNLSSEELQSQWLKWDLIRGKTVSFLQNGESREGHARGIDQSGHLLVMSDSGETRSFNTSISKVRW